MQSERGVDCPGALPEPSDPRLVERATTAKNSLGDRVFVLGHHYQRDEVIAFADVTGDSFKLARDAAARPGAEYIVFPRTGLWWLEYYEGLRDYLDARCQAVVREDDCLVFALPE